MIILQQHAKILQNTPKCQKFKEPNWFAYELCLKQIDFEYFVQMLRPGPWSLLDWWSWKWR